MTEDEWKSCQNPRAMLRAIASGTGQRRILLFLCGIMRSANVVHSIEDLDQWLEREEKRIDQFGQMSSDYLLRRFPPQFESGYYEHSLIRPSKLAIVETLVDELLSSSAGADPSQVMRAVLRRGEGFIVFDEQRGKRASLRREFYARTCDHIRELFPPANRDYRHSPEFVGGGLLLPTGQIFRVPNNAKLIAEGIQEDGAFDRLPILADALEDADCPDRDWLDHFRHGTNHARGCWALDLVLGRN